jgi:protein-tyrosine kinase
LRQHKEAMSRIDEALKRARAATTDQAGKPQASAAPSPIPAADVFEDAWSVGEPLRPRSLAAVPKENGASPEALASPSPGERGGERWSPDGSKGTLAVFRNFHPMVAEKVVATATVKPTSVEQYRRLAGTLHHAQIEQNIKVVMITSALASEGKSLTATNLALTFSESYRRSVLLIDADLRRPSLHETFQVPNVSGLGDGLRAGQDEKLALVEISPRLTLLTAGRPDPDPMSGLASDRMKHLLEEASARFDWVVVDTPPVGLLPDANLMARMVDATLFVVRAGRTPYQVIQKAVATIGRDRIMGVVLNGTDETLDTSYNYYRYYDTYGKKDTR